MTLHQRDAFHNSLIFYRLILTNWMGFDHENPAKTALVVASYRIQKSLAKFAIRLGLSSGTMTELVRRAFVDAAVETIEEQGEKVQATRIGAMTGLYRKEIVRLREIEVPGAARHEERYNRSARVVTGWLRDADFHDDAGDPAVLNLRGERSFSELVKRYSGDIAMTALREELQRLRIIEETEQGQLKLLSRGFVPTESVEGIHILGSDTADLINTIQHNISTDEKPARFQRKVLYVGIADRFADEFREYAAQASQKLLEDLDTWLAERDVETGEQSEKLNRLGVGIYHIETSAREHTEFRDGSNDS